MREQLTEFVEKTLSFLKEVSFPGDLFVGIDATDSEICIVTLRKTFSGFCIVKQRCYCISLAEFKEQKLDEFLRNVAHIAVLAPSSATHYMLSGNMSEEEMKLGGASVDEQPDIDFIKVLLNKETDLITFWRLGSLAKFPDGIPTERSHLFSRLNALNQLTKYYSLSDARLSTSSPEGYWKLILSDKEESTLGLLDEQNAVSGVQDKYGASLCRIHDLPLKDSQQAAFGAALTLLNKDSSEIDLRQGEVTKADQTVLIKYLAFRGILLLGMLTLIMYGAIAGAVYYYSDLQLKLQTQNINLIGQKNELVSLKRSNQELRGHKHILDSLAIPSSFTALQLLQFAEITPKGVWFSQIINEREEASWNFSGYAEGDEKVALLLNNFQSTLMVSGIELKQLLTKSEFRGRIKRENYHNGYVYFEVVLAIL
ncbi:MAG: hypothetical protein ACRBF0_08810 [Calditrichia bacterium]